MTNSPIKSRTYYALDICLDSPICVSSGEGNTTDADVLVNGSKEYFIPGTSLAGAIRNFLGMEKTEKNIMGYSNQKDGQMSSVYISDLYFDESPIVSDRDGVKLSDKKTVDNKFDMEILETGASGKIYLNYIVREADDSFVYEKAISSVFQAIQNGEIRFGSNKNRGFGRLKINKIYKREFNFNYAPDADDEKKKEFVKNWIAFKQDSKNISFYQAGISYGDWLAAQTITPENKYVKIAVPLKLTGGISVRRYSTKPNMADYEQITCNNMPVIPGSSWNGAIRADIHDILLSLCISLGISEENAKDQTERLIRMWFGSIPVRKKNNVEKEENQNEKDNKTEEEKTARQSNIVIGESIIKNSTALPVKRNKINRFDNSTVNGALYSEISYFGGTTILEMMIKKDEASSYQALLAIIKMVIQDIEEGYVPIGGLAAVGRGIFEANPEQSIEYSEEISWDDCTEELYSLLLGKEHT